MPLHPSAQHRPRHWSHRGQGAKPSVTPRTRGLVGDNSVTGSSGSAPGALTGAEESLASRNRGHGKMTQAGCEPI